MAPDICRHLSRFVRSHGVQLQDGRFYCHCATTVNEFHSANSQIAYPDRWLDGKWQPFQRFQELVARCEMSPAEALDYWAVHHANVDSIDWAANRDVDPEAVRKNIRQAKAKLNDENLEATHEAETFNVVRTDEIPAVESHYPDKDVFYVPAKLEDESDLTR